MLRGLVSNAGNSEIGIVVDIVNRTAFLTKRVERKELAYTLSPALAYANSRCGDPSKFRKSHKPPIWARDLS
jgi:hypothetical protein